MSKPLATTIQAPYVRSIGVTGAQFIGTAMAARQIAGIDNAGFYCAPFTFPDSAIPKNNAYVFITIQPAFVPIFTGQIIKLLLRTTITSVNLDINSFDQTFLWPIPDPFSSDIGYRILLDNGNGRTFNPLQFKRDDFIGFQIQRMGADPADTLAQSVKIAESLTFQINRRCCN